MSTNAQKSWYDTGFGGMKHEEDRLAALSGPQRFWIPSGGNKLFVFLDDEPCCIYEHNPKINGSWKNWITCLNGVSDDIPCCEILGDKTKYYVGYFTVIDCSDYTDKKGNKYQYELKLLPAKIKTLKKFRRKKEERGSLVNTLFKATREDDKSPSCGDEFEFQREADLAKLLPLVIYKGKKLVELIAKANETPENVERYLKTFKASKGADGKIVPSLSAFNYFEVLKPTLAKDLRKMLGSAKVEAGGGNASGATPEGAKADDDVPF